MEFIFKICILFKTTCSLDVSRQLIKEQQRRPLYNELMTRRNEDIAEVKDVLCRESCQKLLAKYLEQLKQKSSK